MVRHNEPMPFVIARDDYLRWPRDIFVDELRDVAHDREQVRRLLDEAFVGSSLSDTIRDWGPLEIGGLVKALLEADIPVATPRRYYRERISPRAALEEPSWPGAFSAWTALVVQLDRDGWMDRKFEKDCVDHPRHEWPHQLASRVLGFEVSWPPTFEYDGIEGITDDDDREEIENFLTTVEWFGDIVARPRRVGREHDFNDCGDHYDTFGVDTGQRLYWVGVNEIFERHHIPFTIETAGEDAGYVVSRVDEARTDLLASAVVASPASARDEVETAISNFRRHGATREDKRGAVFHLGRVLESVRGEVKTGLLHADERDLFIIANQYDVRHSRESQKSSYRVEMLDWIFWLNLATIELVFRIRESQQGSDAPEPEDGVS